MLLYLLSFGANTSEHTHTRAAPEAQLAVAITVAITVAIMGLVI